MTDQPTSSITLHDSRHEFGEEIIRLDKEGFHYRGQFIADAGEAHHLMVKFLRQQTQPEPQGPTDEELLDFGSDIMGDCLPCDHDLLIAFASAVLARWGRPAIEPQGPVLDCDEIEVPVWHRGDDFYVYKEGYTAGWAAGVNAAADCWGRPAIEPRGPTDEELEATAKDAEILSMKKQGGLTSPTPDGIHAQLQEQRLAGLRAVAACFGRPAIEPVPVAERLPGPDAVDENGNCWLWDSEGCFWDWTYIRTRTKTEMYSYTHWLVEMYSYTHWLPHHALPVPQQEHVE